MQCQTNNPYPTSNSYQENIYHWQFKMQSTNLLRDTVSVWWRMSLCLCVWDESFARRRTLINQHLKWKLLCCLFLCQSLYAFCKILSLCYEWSFLWGKCIARLRFNSHQFWLLTFLTFNISMHHIFLFYKIHINIYIFTLILITNLWIVMYINVYLN